MDQHIQNLLENTKRCYLYGAQTFAYGIYRAVVFNYEISVASFLVSNYEENPSCIDHISVILANQVKKEDRQELVLIATPVIYHTEIMSYLDKLGFCNYIPVDSELEYSLIGKFLYKTEGYLLMENITGSIKIDNKLIINNSITKNTKVLIAKSIKDKKLKTNYSVPIYAEPIYLGNAIIKSKTNGLTDDIGENISDKNLLYSELTATYWAWKHIQKNYIGIFHYRRYLNVGEKELMMLSRGLADVILPLPFICYPSARAQYERYINKTDIQRLKEALKICCHEYYCEALKILDGTYLYNYNILIAKKEVFFEYCEFLFPILFYIEKNDLNSKNRNDRYLGYIGEVLTSLYFMLHKNKYKIVHTELVWME